jgi:fibronectin type 3 domain-containing protein
MSKSKADGRNKPLMNKTGRRRVFVVAGLILSLIAASAAFGQLSSLWSTAPKAVQKKADITTQSLTPGSPSKEYIYAGGRLVATEEPQPACVPPQAPTAPAATPGNTQVTLTWAASPGAGSYNVKRSTINGGPYGIVAAGVTATSHIDTGLTNGTTYYYVVTALSGTCESGNSPQVPGLPSGGGGGTNNAAFVSQSVPASMTTGQTTSVTVTMNNSGTTTWSAGTYSLGSQNPAGNANWGVSQVNLSSPVSPGSNAAFTFNVTAPAAAGTYNFQWQMQQNGAGYFGGLSTNVAVSVTGGGGGGTNNASFVSQSVPGSMTTSQTVAASITMSNTGTTTWTAGTYYLGSQNPQGNATWGTNLVSLPASVSPGSQATFAFNITAPATAGTYNLQWQMFQSGVGYFGGLSTNVAVTVTGGGGSGVDDATFVSQSVPSTLNPGQSVQVLITMHNAGTSVWFTDNYKIGSQNPTDNTTWGLNRVTPVTNTSPGSDRIIKFDITAPTIAGVYNFQWRMFHVGVGFFGAATQNVAITVGSVGPLPPAAPSSLAATAVSSSQINLTWVDNSNNEDGFKIERKTGAGAFTQIATVGAGVTSYPDTTGLSPSTQYTYQVRAYNVAGNSAFSAPASATTGAPAPPTAPSDLAATAISSSQVNLTWLDNSNNEDGFKIERKTGVGAFIEIFSSAANTTSYSDTSVAASTDYTYRVLAYNGSGGASPPSNEKAVTTPAGETLLLADDFNDSLFNTSNWGNSVFSGAQDTGVAVAEANQRFEIGPLIQTTTTSRYNGITSASSYDFTAAYCQVQLTQPANVSTNSDAMLTIGLDVNNYYRIYVEGATLICQKKVGGTKTTLSTIAYDQINHKFLRIRHDSALGKVVFETAPASGGAPGQWVERWNEAWNTTSAPLTAVKFELKAGTFETAAAAPGTVIFDNFRAAKPSSPSAPTVSAISPNTGSASGGTSVTITGTGFSAGASVSLGGAAATSVSVVSSTSINAVTPAHAAGTVSVVVTNTNGQSGTLANGFTYGSPPPTPTVTAISPASGPSTGGTSVTITGTGFSTGATVSIGGSAATNVNTVSGTSITAATPANVAGAANVVVTNPDNQSGTLASGYTYTAAETVLLADDFNAASLDTNKWAVSILSGTQDTSISVSQTSGRLQIGPLLQNISASHYNGISSGSVYNFTGAYAYAQLTEGPATSTTADAMFTVLINNSNQYRIYVEAGVLKFEKKLGGTKTTIGSVTFNATSHAFWRIRHNSATDQIVFETAPNNAGVPGTWTAQQTVTREMAVTAMQVELKAGTWQSEASAPGTVTFDNFKMAKP